MANWMEYRFSTGCHFISTMHALYPNRRNLKVLPKGYKLGGYSITPLFEHYGAATWHRSDAMAIKMVGDGIVWLFSQGKIIAGIVLLVVVVAGRRRVVSRYRRGSGGCNMPDVLGAATASKGLLLPLVDKA